LDYGELVGTVRLWRVRLGRGRRGLMLGPLAVDDKRRGEGIGTKLMEAAMAKIEAAGQPSVFLVGATPATTGASASVRTRPPGCTCPARSNGRASSDANSARARSAGPRG